MLRFQQATARKSFSSTRKSFEESHWGLKIISHVRITQMCFWKCLEGLNRWYSSLTSENVLQGRDPKWAILDRPYGTITCGEKGGLLVCDLRISSGGLILGFFSPQLAANRGIVAITNADNSYSTKNVNRTLSEICAFAVCQDADGVRVQEAMKSLDRYIFILEKPVTKIDKLSYCQDPSAKTFNRPTRILCTHMPTHGTDLQNDVSAWLKSEEAQLHIYASKVFDLKEMLRNSQIDFNENSSENEIDDLFCECASRLTDEMTLIYEGDTLTLGELAVVKVFEKRTQGVKCNVNLFFFLLTSLSRLLAFSLVHSVAPWTTRSNVLKECWGPLAF